MKNMEILKIWLGLPLVDRLKLYEAGKTEGLEGFIPADLFPEKKLIEGWIKGEVFEKRDIESEAFLAGLEKDRQEALKW